MSTTPWVPVVNKIQNRTEVSAEVVNPIIDQHTQREQYLYEKFQELTNKSVLVAYDQPLLDEPPLAKVGRPVFYSKETNKIGLKLATVAFETTNLHQASFLIANSSYTVGLIKSISSNGKTADVYLYGLVELDFNIDNPTYGVVQTNETGLTSDDADPAFQPGPYFLSRSESGKLTRNPAGVAIYVGYAITQRQFLLAPNVSEFNKLFTQYYYTVLDRPAGVPSVSGNTWTINNANTALVGWIPVATAASLGYIVPPNAKFFYNLPNVTQIQADGGISTADQVEQASLALALPPFPPNLSFLTSNGVVQINRDFDNVDGIYKIDQFGIWWFSDQNGYQPWSSEIAGQAANIWKNNKGSDPSRPRLFLQFAKFNPDLRESVVSSLTPIYPNSTIVKFYSKATPTTPASFGDLLVDVDIQYVNNTTAASGTAISDLTFDKPTGKVRKAITPIISSIVGTGGITATVNSATGAAVLSALQGGLNGRVESVEPENARYEFNGLHSYLLLTNPSTLSSGLVGKFLLPTNIPTSNLNFTLFLFAATNLSGSASNNNLAFDFSYSITKPGGVINSTVTGPTTVNVPIPLPYALNTCFRVTPAAFSIPASALSGDSIINFRLTRKPSSNTNDIGVVDVYWNIG